MTAWGIAVAQDEELDLGYSGRLAALNGLPSGAPVHAGARQIFSMPTCTSNAIALAACAGKTASDFARHHTLIPALRPASSHVGTERERKIRTSQASGRSLPMFSISKACLCEDCLLLEGLASSTVQVWRRDHHLPNVDWCVHHRKPLRSFSLAAFQARPVDALKGPRDEDHGAGRSVESGSVLDRYGRLLATWLARDEAMSSWAFNHVVREGCSRHGLRAGETGRKRVISDLVKEQFPDDWLRIYWPSVLHKTKTAEYISRVDGVRRDRHVAYPGATYALVLAALFETVEEPQMLLESRNREILAMVAANRRGHAERIQCALDSFLQGASIKQASQLNGLTSTDLEGWLRKSAMASRQSSVQRVQGAQPVTAIPAH